MDVRTTLRPDAGSAAAARRFVADVLSQRGFSRSGIEDAVLMTSEAITNLIVQSGAEVGLLVVADAGLARVELHDAKPGSTAIERSGAQEGTDLGLQVIDAVAEAWGVDEVGAGRCIWFEVRS
ncbi:MAG: ATP-binding protein [Acidimicrobiales bacterium]